MHYPYRSHNCEGCHDTVGAVARGAEESGYREHVSELASQGAYGLVPTAEERAASLLRYRVDKLCFQCHRDMDPDSPGNKGRWLHGPFQAGVCMGCHSPHESDNPGLLVAYPVEKLCARCHSDFHGKKGSSLYPSRPCGDCHSPHSQKKAPSNASAD